MMFDIGEVQRPSMDPRYTAKVDKTTWVDKIMAPTRVIAYSMLLQT